MSTRELGKIQRVLFGDDGEGHILAQVSLGFDGSGQALQWCIPADMVDGIRQSFLGLFGVVTEAEIVGLECYALRAFPTWSATIVGLETMSGKRLVRGSLFPECGNELAYMYKSLMGDLRHAERRVAECRDRLDSIEEGYVEWVST